MVDAGETGADVLHAAGLSIERADRARRALPRAPAPGSDEADVVAWAEETVITMTELSELIAEAWERVAVALEAVAGIEAPEHDGADAEPAIDVVERTVVDDAADQPDAEALLAPTSFLDAMGEGLPDSSHAA